MSIEKIVIKEVFVDRYKMDNFLAYVRSTVGSKSFSKYLGEVDGSKEEIIGNGNKACAYHTSLMYSSYGLLKKFVLTVNLLLRAVTNDPKWRKISEPRPGNLVIYKEQLNEKGNPNMHAGIYIGDGKVVDNDPISKVPEIHSCNYREIHSFWWHSDMDTW